MGRGQYDRTGVKRGPYNTQKKQIQQAIRASMPDVPPPAEKVETEEEIWARIENRFQIAESMTHGAVDGICRALIVSGPAGLGKSYTIEQILRAWDPKELSHRIIKGYVRATGLYRMLWQYRDAGSVLVFDDADSVFEDATALAMLKAVCDTTEERKVSYLAETKLLDDEMEQIPRQFVFEGSIIFITNQDFDVLIQQGNMMAPHFKALISRSHYIDLAMKTQEDYIVRIKQVMKQGLLDKYGFGHAGEQDIMEFIYVNKDRLRELSLRMVIKLANLRQMMPNGWKNTAETTCCYNVN